MAERFRADQVGSLLRPPELLVARAAHAEGRLTADALRAAEDQAILAALGMQRQVGMDMYTDGEYRRTDFMSAMTAAVRGFVPGERRGDWRGASAAEAAPTHVVVERLQPAGRLAAHESAYLRAHAPGPFKITIPSPVLFIGSAYQAGVTDRAYPTRADLLRDVVAITSREVQALAAEGVPYVQLDAPGYTHYVDAQLVARMRQNGTNPDQALEAAIAADNACLDAIGSGVTRAVHLCRGNNRSSWLAEGGYDPVAERLFNGLHAERFLLEYDSERAGGFTPLRFVPADKTVVLGLVTTKEPRLESQDALLRRIEEAARYVPLERLALSPQCGFASVAAGNLLSWDDQRRKLELVVETAHHVWGSSA